MEVLLKAKTWLIDNKDVFDDFTLICVQSLGSWDQSLEALFRWATSLRGSQQASEVGVRRGEMLLKYWRYWTFMNSPNLLEFTFMILLCFLFVERNDGTEMH